MKTAVIYLRRSTERQEQSIPDQRRHIQTHADRAGYEIVGEYLDDAISGHHKQGPTGLPALDDG